MAVPFARRPAGIRFVDQPPKLPEKLPRMDIAVFAGFASAGPVNLPVVVEDAAQFAAVFGGDVALARDDKRSASVTGCLAPAVRAFFRNGGRRCWIVRLAQEPETDVFPLPGLARIEDGNLTPAFARARSPGSWFDACQVSTALAVQAFKLLDRDVSSRFIRAVPPVSGGFRQGDLLRLSFSGGDREIFLRVESVAEDEASPPGPRRSVGLNVTLLGTLRTVSEPELESGAYEFHWMNPHSIPAPAPGIVLREVSSPPNSGDGRITLEVPAHFSPPPGTLLQVGSGPFLFQVEEYRRSSHTGTPPGPGAQLTGRVFSWSGETSASPPEDPDSAELLTFELRVRRNGIEGAHLAGLGFIPGHPRFWNTLPDDARVFGANPDDPRDPLTNAARDPHFPLAGMADTGAAPSFIPVGMSPLPEPAMAAQHSGRSPLERDGLAHFSAALFLDPRLKDSGVTTLLADADFIRFQTRGAAPLGGIHAALAVEEATLIAVPDAIHHGWDRAELPQAPAPGPSKPREHPSWWHFLACDPPESPPAGIEGPSRGHFLKCDLRVLTPPVLSCEGPDAAGFFTLHWSIADPDATFILEEATGPDWSDAFELRRTDEVTHAVSARAPGDYYYRVRSEADGESSDWSNGVVVSIPALTQWRMNDEFEADTLLDIHRALLRLCAARGDIMAVLSLPEHFREDEAIAYRGSLTAGRLAGGSMVRPLGTGEAHASGFGAVYHPWQIAREETGGLLSTPPDGAASGIIARRSLARGAWIAPANETFAGIVALTPRLSPARISGLLHAQINHIRQEPRGFMALNADTLSDEEELRPIHVRRLLILLRRAALRLGMTFVFEPNDAVLRRTVQGAFESVLQQLFTRGAFAGATPADSYRVVTDDTANIGADFDNGRFRVDLKVAPAAPMSFLTVRLVQTGERATAVEII